MVKIRKKLLLFFGQRHLEIGGRERLRPPNFRNLTTHLHIRIINLYINKDGVTPNKDGANSFHPKNTIPNANIPKKIDFLLIRVVLILASNN
jgi:hypothetical protein